MRIITIGFACLAILAEPVSARPMRPRDVDQLPSTEPTAVISYGADPLQIGELRLPPGKGPFPVAVVVHGGCWTKGFATRRNTAAMSSALTAKGIATWNIEYRQVGEPGAGWPGTFQDWAAATDHLRMLAKHYPLDLKRVVAVGHSAGAHAALWIAARGKLPSKSEVRTKRPLPIKAAVAIDGPGDLASFRGVDEKICGKDVIDALVGGTPETQAGRYVEAAPQQLLPLRVPQYLVSASPVFPAEAAEAYRRAAAAKGDKVEVIAPNESDHFNIIAPGEPQWDEVEALILKAFR